MLVDTLGKVILSMIVGALVHSGWERWIQPWIVEHFKEPLKLKQNFFGVLKWSDVGDHRIELRPRKRGYDITGTLRFLDGRHAGKEYEINGRFQHRLLTFTYWPTDAHSISQGSGTFLLATSGKLVGYFAFIGESSGAIESSPCEFVPA